MSHRNVLKIVTLALVLLLGSTAVTFAQQDQKATKTKEESGHPAEGGKTEIPATMEGIFNEVDKHLGEIDKVVEANKLDKVHESAFAIRDLLLALPEKVGELPAEKKTALNSSLNKIKQQAGLLDKFGDAGDAAQVKTVLAKFKAEIETIRKLVGTK